MTTFFPRQEDVTRKWYVVDGAGKPIGRVATFVAGMLMGKHKPEYTPHLDLGDHIILINAEKVNFTGNKRKFKVYRRHSTRPGSLKQVTVEQMLAKHPTRPLELAVKGMLPKTKLGRAMFKKLRVYSGADHPHEAQQPQPLDVKL